MFKLAASALALAAAVANPISLGSIGKVEEEGKLCNVCVQLDGSAINALLNYILNNGVIGGCGKLCSSIDGKAAHAACTLVCDVVGLKEFIKVLENADFDPIWLCEELKQCDKPPADAAAKVVSSSATPASVKDGDTITLGLVLDVINATGVGEIQVAIDGGFIDISQSFINEGFAPGSYNFNVDLQLQDDPDNGVQWDAGVYNYTFAACQGTCGSHHPETIEFGVVTNQFTVTN